MEQPDGFNWPPLKTDPDILSEYMHSIGLPEDWVVEPVISIDEEQLPYINRPVVAFILALGDYEEKKQASSELGHVETSFFMKQTDSLNNTCGIIAFIHSVLNNLDKFSLTEGSILQKYYTATKDLSPEERAASLESNIDLQAIHKQYANATAAVAADDDDESGSDSDESVMHHFITFVLNKNGQIVELDDTNSGPVVVKDHSDDFIQDMAQIILEKIENGDYSEENFKIFTLNKDNME
ncbi:ubiquitin carboxyl-terminal hydrolase isozyme l3 [Stylonychia lemnae]|uniref:Ubiquitin carboxyl-terminal hydrolase n=1 Tax=Stylonychia lemnae TaxID=5949 RepID=A0A078AAT5_STYLE|nr:ubiquitin carboxyl-terminal hydrolase isozyme l3 [Stylonychia lemnae]|eukprot:CDW78722.1 ubiquitin carboxyl-terminal hydrolase isozyme l3 [Stylonychia lemnae]